MNLLSDMLEELPFSSEELCDLIATAQYRYKVYSIPKRQKGQFRTIAQPSPEIKLLQHWLMKRIFSHLPVHKVATAYCEGKSIADHATQHAPNRFLLKMDFKDFFHSISAVDVLRYLIEFRKFPLEDAKLITSIVCWRNKSVGRLCLSIGAPSSPILSNALLYAFDKKVVQLCQPLKVKYSRYADDLAFSTNKKNVLIDISKQIQLICDELDYPKLEVNHKKTVSTSRAFRRVLVGLILTPDGKVSLGREKKRRLRTQLYLFSKNRLDISDIPKLRGELAFAWSVESVFIQTLLKQLGEDVFRQLDLPFSLNSDDLT